MEKEVLLSNYEKGLASKGKLRTHYLRYAHDFLSFSDGIFDRHTIDKYIDYLRKKRRYSDGTVNFAFGVIRTMFNRNQSQLASEGWDWPYRRGEGPIIREDKITAPALSPEVIYKMIETTKENGEIEEKVFLALSTTYGLRREELLNISNDDIDFRGKSIHIATLKHGRDRTHMIPEEIVPYLKDYGFDTVRSEFGMLEVWYRIEHRCGLRHTDQVGWHSIRRTLNTLLGDELPRVTVMSFLRWKQRTSSDMSFRYSAQTFVGFDGEITKVVGESRQVDEKVFAVHPFLKYWR